MPDISEDLRQQVQQAIDNKTPLSIVGGNTKSFYGHHVNGNSLSVSKHEGVINYDPTELVITVRAGTRLTEVKDILAGNGQMLGFEPPGFGEAATIGGVIACNFSGPARPYHGAARDFVLGMKIINGHAQQLKFGGQVIKNVAGYDVSRLQCGAMGTLGVILDVSLKVLPIPEQTQTRCLKMEVNKAIETMNQLAARSGPVTGACYVDKTLYVRLAGNETAVSKAADSLGGDEVKDADFWSSVCEHQHRFFKTETPLWRLSVPPATNAMDDLTGTCLVDWGGAQRWLLSEDAADHIRQSCQQAGGHATLYRSTKKEINIFQPLSAPLVLIHKNLKQAFDPHSILNPGRMYPDW